MYIYLTAFGKLRSRNGRWLEQDIQDIPLYQLYEQYTAIWLVLTHDSYDDVLAEGEEPRKVSLDMMGEVQTKLAWRESTVSQWLQENGNQTLPTIDGVVELDSATVRYQDAFRSGYDVSMVKPGKHPDAQYPRSEKTDLLLTKEGVDYQDMYRHVLVTINGIIHQTSYSEYGLHVTDGALSGSIANNNSIGLTSFKDVGRLSYIPLTDAMIHPHSDGRPLKEGAYIDLGQDLSDKTVLLSLGGYLHVLDRTYAQVSDNVMKIDFRNYPLPQKLFELQEFIDLKSLDLTEYAKNENLIEVGEIYSDEKLRAFLKLPQTFFIVVDTSQLYVEKHQLEKTNLPGKWYAHVDPIFPLLKGNGKLEDYVYRQEGKVWVVSADSNYQIRQYNFETTQWKADPGIDNTKPTVGPLEWSRGFFLEIGRDV